MYFLVCIVFSSPFDLGKSNFGAFRLGNQNLSLPFRSVLKTCTKEYTICTQVGKYCLPCLLSGSMSPDGALCLVV